MYQRLQCRDKYFFKIKFVFFLYLQSCQHHQRKTICLYVYISDIRQIVGYWTPVFIQRFPWSLYITITYNLLHLRRCHSNSVNTGSRLPICSDVKTRKRRNVVGIDMIRNNRIVKIKLSNLKVYTLQVTPIYTKHWDIYLYIYRIELILNLQDNCLKQN